MDSLIKYDLLISKAKEAMANAYVPYSHFQVGAALVTKSGKIYTGCNVENSSFGATICAERVAFTKAVSEGEREFEAVAVVGSSGDFTYPCGICRQFMSEFGTHLKLVFGNGKEVKVHSLKDLLPEAFVTFE